MENEYEKFLDYLNQIRSFVLTHKSHLTKKEFSGITSFIDALIFDLEYYYSDLYIEDKSE